MNSQTTDAIWYAVQAAVTDNVTPREFIREVSSAWQDVLREEAKAVDHEFAQILKREAK